MVGRTGGRVPRVPRGGYAPGVCAVFPPHDNSDFCSVYIPSTKFNRYPKSTCVSIEIQCSYAKCTAYKSTSLTHTLTQLFITDTRGFDPRPF